VKVKTWAKKINLDKLKGIYQRVLIMNNVETQRNLITKILTPPGYNSVIIPSNKAAVNFLQKKDTYLTYSGYITHPSNNNIAET
jgi:CheY-like chemotaxis protein